LATPVGLEASPAQVKALARVRAMWATSIASKLQAALATGYRPTDDPDDRAGFGIAVISVPTPLRDGQPDLSFIEVTDRPLAAYLTPGASCVDLVPTTT
jgi:UDP-N-acetyl-D-glucosamine dehydrogenase